MIVSAIRPPNSPARMDSIGKPGTPHVDGAVVLVALVLVVLVVLVVVDVEVEVTTTVDVEVVVPGMTSGP